MIHCRRCQRTNPAGTAICECGADLSVDGISMGGESTQDGSPMGQLPDLPGLPDLEAPPGASADDPFDALSDTETGPPPTPLGSSRQEVITPRGNKDAGAERRHRFAVEPALGDDSATGELPKTSASSHGEDRAQPEGPPVAPELGSSVYETPVGEHRHADPALPDEGSLRTTLGVYDPPGAGEIACHRCGRPVAEDRRFCRCGELLIKPDLAEVEATDDVPTTNWWRRLTGTGVGKRGDQRTWGQRAKDTGARKGMRYGTAVSSQTRMGRIAMAVLAGGGLLALAGPLRGEAKRIPNLFVAEDPAEVQANEVTYEPPLPWAGAWDPNELGLGLASVDEGTQCASEQGLAADGPVLTGVFAQPTDVTELWLNVGDTRAAAVPADDEGVGPLVQPSQPPNAAEVTIDEQCRVLDLIDSTETQKFDLNVEDATSFSLVVVGVHGVDWQVAPFVQIEDITWIKK